MTLKKLFTPLKHQDLDSPITVEFVVTVASAAVKTEEGNKPNKTYLVKKYMVIRKKK